MLAPELEISAPCNGYWYWGRPTVEELHRDLRKVMRKVRPDFDLGAPGLREAWDRGERERIEEKRQHELASIPFFDGLTAGEPDALVKSFAAVPELHDPIRGRVKGTRAFEAFASETSSWLHQHNVSVEDVAHAVTEGHGFEEVVLHFDGQNGQVDLPVAIVADRRHDLRVEELRIYFSSWPIAGRHANRPPLLQPDPRLRVPDVVGDYQRALAAGDVDAIAAAFEPDSCVREPAGGRHVHRGRDGLRSFYELLFSNGGGSSVWPQRTTLYSRAHEHPSSITAQCSSGMPPPFENKSS